MRYLSWQRSIMNLLLSSILFAITTCIAYGQPNAQATPLEIDKPVGRTLATGQRHAYTISIDAGGYAVGVVQQQGIDVVIEIFGPDGKRLNYLDSPNAESGPEPFTIVAATAGTYRVDVFPLDSGDGSYEIRSVEKLSGLQYSERTERQRVADADVVSWINARALPLKSLTAASGFDDLQPLKKILADVRIVGLGEATHGTREFFQVKHRLLEFLVREMGFRVFAIEASASACMNINDYVMGRTDDGVAALNSQGFWTWNTVEVMDMINWMRAYNSAVSVERKVAFVGFDMQMNSEAFARLTRYLREYDSALANQTDSLRKPRGSNGIKYEQTMEGIASAASGGDADSARALFRFQEMRAGYNALLDTMIEHAEDLTARSSSGQFDTAFFYLQILNQYIDAYAPDAKSSVRDRNMAENIARYVNTSDPMTRFVVWAHNDHIRKGASNGMRTMGEMLQQKFGDQYYAVLLAFDQGAFQSRDFGEDGKAELAEFTIGSAPDHMLEWYLAGTKREQFFLDLRSAERKTPDVVTWLATPHPMRSIGSGYANDVGPESIEYVPKSDMDGIVYIRRTARARPNSSVQNVRTTDRAN